MGSATPAFLGSVIVLVTGFRWARKAASLTLPRSFGSYRLAMGLGLALGVVAFAVGTEGAWVAAGAGIAVVGGGLFLLFSFTSAMDRKLPAVRVGGEIIDFEALDAERRPFKLSSLKGRPFLLKFFRGHW